MGFFKDFKRDFAQAVNELMPDSDGSRAKNISDVYNEKKEEHTGYEETFLPDENEYESDEENDMSVKEENYDTDENLTAYDIDISDEVQKEIMKEEISEAETEDDVIPEAETDDDMIPETETEDDVTPEAETEDDVIPETETEDDMVSETEIEDDVIPEAETEDDVPDEAVSQNDETHEELNAPPDDDEEINEAAEGETDMGRKTKKTQEYETEKTEEEYTDNEESTAESEEDEVAEFETELTNDDEISDSFMDDTTYITKNTKITGDLETDGNIDLIGRVEGNVMCKGKLILGGTVKGNVTVGELYANQAKVEGEITSEGAVKVGVGTVIVGNITATSAVIAGAVKGDIDVNGPVIVDSTAVIIGNIKSRSVQINNGAAIEGLCSQAYADVDLNSYFN